jgi:tRNA A-37 threonylcarbamoyl transferase component Bud32
VVVIAKHRDALQQAGLTTLEQARAFRAELIKDHRGRRDIQRLTLRDETGQGRVLFLKRNWRPYKKDGLTSLLRRGCVWSQSRQEWENSLALERAGVRVARLIAYGEECGPLWERFSFILTESAPGQTVEQFLRECRDRALRRRVFDALAHWIRRMHDAGFATPDLFTRHIFVETAGGEPAFCLIDMARLDHAKELGPKQRARDLAALNVAAPLRHVTPRERIRFLQVYAGGTRRDLARLIACRVAHLLQRRKFRDFDSPALAT